MASKFVWYELMTSDASGAESFYRDVVGWSARDAGMTNLKYTLLLVGEIPVAGLMQCPPDVPQGQGGPGWLGYVGVADVDATLAQAQKLGASVHRASTDIPGVGRFAVLADPQGAVFALFKPNGASTPPAPMTPGGTIGWHELHAADAEKAFALLQRLVRLAEDSGQSTWGHSASTRSSATKARRWDSAACSTSRQRKLSPIGSIISPVADIDAAAGARHGERRHSPPRAAASTRRRLDHPGGRIRKAQPLRSSACDGTGRLSASDRKVRSGFSEQIRCGKRTRPDAIVARRHLAAPATANEHGHHLRT